MGCWEWCMHRPESEVTLLSICKAPTITVTGTTAHNLCKSDKISSPSLSDSDGRKLVFYHLNYTRDDRKSKRVVTCWATLLSLSNIVVLFCLSQNSDLGKHISQSPTIMARWAMSHLSKQSVISRWTWFFLGPFPADIGTGFFHLGDKRLVFLVADNDEIKFLRDV